MRFYGDLARLAWNADELGHAEVTLGVPRSVKDAVESSGVPHTEVDLVLVNGESVGFERLLAEGDRISVFPPFHRLDIEQLTQVRPPPLPQPRFVLDVHLGRLTRRLRLLGFDCLYRNDYSDDELADLARDHRCLLTRDRGLLMRRCVTHGCLLRSDEAPRQAVEVVSRFDLEDRLAPFSRCIRCNGNLLPVDKNAVRHRLEARTRTHHDDFSQCGSCRRLYWRGSHHASLSSFVEDVRHATRDGLASQPSA
ncbi:MAG: Mut7-C ubiquitin/RNAse domain-containing protein [Actinomycetota bacterium]|nr:Mut7-C ubiquitin/RNAse domain-containing protein [Actinomycetota bacterium]